MGCDDPDRLSWERIDLFLQRDVVCGFRLIPASSADGLRFRLLDRNCRFDTWDMFLADRAAALGAAEAIVSRGLPDGLAELAKPTDPESEYIVRIQSRMAAVGLVPFSASMLVGALRPSKTVALGDRDGNVVAVAHGYLPHNSYSDFRLHAWGGLVAVAESHRGKG